MAILDVPVKKAGAVLQFDTDKLKGEDMNDVRVHIYMHGLIPLVNARQSNVPTPTAQAKMKPEEVEGHKAEAMKRALENINALYEGKIKATKGAKASKGDKLVEAEALRMAREQVRDAIKKDKDRKISHYKASEITVIARELLAASPELMDEAREALAKRTAKPVSADLLAKLVADPTLVAKDAEKKAATKKPKPDMSIPSGAIPTRRRAQPNA